jgi:hypothetical protein
VARWRHYEPWLGSLRELLVETANAWHDPAQIKKARLRFDLIPSRFSAEVHLPLLLGTNGTRSVQAGAQSPIIQGRLVASLLMAWVPATRQTTQFVAAPDGTEPRRPEPPPGMKPFLLNDEIVLKPDSPYGGC